MNENIFDIIKLVLQIGLLVFTAFIVPSVKKFLDKNTSEKQREDLIYWSKFAVKVAEQIYKEGKQGKFKKEYVIKYLSRMGLKIDKEQLDILIDMIVAEFNKNGWNI